MTPNFSLSKSYFVKPTKRIELIAVKKILDKKKPQPSRGRDPIIEVKKAKSNSGIFLKQLFIYNSIKDSLLCLFVL